MKHDPADTIVQPHPHHSSLWFISSIVVALLLVIIGLLLYQNTMLKQQLTLPVVSPTPSANTEESPVLYTNPSPDPTENWKTYTNTKYNYSIRYSEPAPEIKRINKYTDDLIEINGSDNLIIRIEPILTSFTSPIQWLTGQKVETYSKKPISCFSQKTVSEIKSLYDPTKTIIAFNDNVLMLDNLISKKDKEVNCYKPEQVRVLVISHNKKLLKITYTFAVEAELILSTFKFTGQTSKTTQDQAIQIVRNLPEVKTWIGQVETGPLGGKAVLVPEEGEKDNVWTIHAFEQLPGHNASFNFFYVDKTTGQVTKEFNF